MPLIVHTREAEEDTVEILTGRTRECVECFIALRDRSLSRMRRWHGSADLVLRRGDVQEFGSTAGGSEPESPLDRILVETDQPVPCAGTLSRPRNEPAYVRQTAATLAALHDVAIEEVGAQTSANFMRLFSI